MSKSTSGPKCRDQASRGCNTPRPTQPPRRRRNKREIKETPFESPQDVNRRNISYAASRRGALKRGIMSRKSECYHNCSITPLVAPFLNFLRLFPRDVPVPSLPLGLLLDCAGPFLVSRFPARVLLASFSSSLRQADTNFEAPPHHPRTYIYHGTTSFFFSLAAFLCPWGAVPIPIVFFGCRPSKRPWLRQSYGSSETVFQLFFAKCCCVRPARPLDPRPPPLSYVRVLQTLAASRVARRMYEHFCL